VFTSDRTGNDELFAMRPDGGGVVELTHDPADDYAPSWSPEGAMIAFVNYTDANRGNIWVMDADGSNPHGLTSGSRRDWWPAWSPDGTTIAFSGEYQIYTMSADGSGVTKLTSLQNASYPAWSPDGARIAFTGDDGRGNGLWVMNADGTDQHQVFRESNIEAGDRLVAGAWSPDGRWILMARSDPGTGHCEDSDLYRIRPDGTDLVRLTHDTFSAGGAWSADGTRIVFSRTFEPSCTSETYEMNPDGSGLVALTRGPANNFDANWRR